MNPEEKNARKISRLLTLMDNDAMSQEDFIGAFQVVIQTIKDLKAENLVDFKLMREAMDSLGDKLKARSEESYDELRGLFDTFYSEQEARMDTCLKRVDSRLEELKDIKNGESPTDAHLLELIKPLVPDAIAIDEMALVNTTLDKVEDRLPMFGMAFRDALELLPEGEKLSPDAIEGLQSALETAVSKATGTKTGWGAHPLKIMDGSTVIAKVARVINFGTNLTATLAADGTITVNASGGGSGGYTVETPSGTVNGSNKTFTVSTTPVYIVVDGITYFDGSGYSIVGTTITTDVAPTGFIRSFYS